MLRSAERPEFWFLFDNARGSYYPRCSPWEGVRNASFDPMSWDECLGHAGVWARVVDAEIAAIDPWHALPEYAAATGLPAGPVPTSANTPFTFGEVEKMEAALDDIRKLLLDNAGKSEDHRRHIEAEIAVLVDASKRFGRKDWFNLAVGGFVTLGLQIALPPEVVRQAFEILKTAVSGVIPLLTHIIASGQQLM